jgi:hypothetical protein
VQQVQLVRAARKHANAAECVRMPFFGVGVDVALMLNAKRPVVSEYLMLSV